MSDLTFYEEGIRKAIEAQPVEITRQREVTADGFRGPETITEGPFIVRIENYHEASPDTMVDQTGRGASLWFEAIGHNLPQTVTQNGEQVSLFQTDDVVFDSAGNKYVVAAPQLLHGKVVRLKLILAET